MKVKDMPNGAILWNGYNIVGIKGNTLEAIHGDKYYDYECVQEIGNPIDFSLEELENANWYCESVKNQTIRALEELLKKQK